nr:MAG TPA: hypothetical protein [Caudoviricetes sp.]
MPGHVPVPDDFLQFVVLQPARLEQQVTGHVLLALPVPLVQLRQQPRSLLSEHLLEPFLTGSHHIILSIHSRPLLGGSVRVSRPRKARAETAIPNRVRFRQRLSSWVSLSVGRAVDTQERPKPPGMVPHKARATQRAQAARFRLYRRPHGVGNKFCHCFGDCHTARSPVLISGRSGLARSILPAHHSPFNSRNTLRLRRRPIVGVSLFLVVASVFAPPSQHRNLRVARLRHDRVQLLLAHKRLHAGIARLYEHAEHAHLRAVALHRNPANHNHPMNRRNRTHSRCSHISTRPTASNRHAPTSRRNLTTIASQL